MCHNVMFYFVVKISIQNILDCLLYSEFFAHFMHIQVHHLVELIECYLLSVREELTFHF